MYASIKEKIKVTKLKLLGHLTQSRCAKPAAAKIFTWMMGVMC